MVSILSIVPRVITYWNKGAERITGYKQEQVIGHSCRDNLLNHVNDRGVQLCQDFCPLGACMQDGNPREVDVFLHHSNGQRIPVLIRASPIRDENGEIIGAVETFSSDTSLMGVRHALHKLRRTVHIDELTAIGNRRFLEGKLRSAIAELEHQPDSALGLLFMDIDHFKVVNDAYGHEVGDAVLRMVSSTLQYNLRKTDFIGRWGGEEFLAILYDVGSLEMLKKISEKLRILVESSRLDLPSESLSVTVSVGATLFLPGDSPETAVHRADELMYQAKHSGRNQVITG